MIKLTRKSDKKSTYVAAEHVTEILNSNGNSLIYSGSFSPLEVIESPEDVVKLIILSKRHNMMLQSCYQASANLLNGEKLSEIIGRDSMP